MLGASTARLVSAATTNATVVKAGRGTLLGWYAWNANAAPAYVKFYDLAVEPTVGTSVPKLTVMVPGVGDSGVPLPGGVAFTNGIAVATTTGAADADTGAVALSEVGVTVVYT